MDVAYFQLNEIDHDFRTDYIHVITKSIDEEHFQKDKQCVEIRMLHLSVLYNV